MRTDPVDQIAERWLQLGRAAAELHDRTTGAAEAFRLVTTQQQDGHAARICLLQQQHDATVAQANEQRDAAMSVAQTICQAQRASLESKATDKNQEINQRAEKREFQAQESYQQALWLVESVYEASENVPKMELLQVRQNIHERIGAMEATIIEAQRLTARFRQRVPPQPQLHTSDVTFNAELFFATELACAIDAARRLRRLRVAGLFRGPILVIPALLMAIACAGICWMLGGRDMMLAIAAGTGFVLTALMAAGLWFTARAEVVRAWQPLHTASFHMTHACEVLQKAAEIRCAELEHLSKVQLRTEREAVHTYWQPILQAIREQRVTRHEELGAKVPTRRAKYDAALQEAIRTASEQCAHNVQQQSHQHADAISSESQRHTEAIRNMQGEHEDARAQCHARWIAERNSFDAFCKDLLSRGASMQPDLQLVDPQRTHFDAALFVGNIRLDARTLAHACPTDAALAWSHEPLWNLPLLRPLPANPSLLVEAPPEQREQALAVLQAAAVRLLVQSPPGKVRLTLMDSVGLGQSFAGFMHLADAMEQLVGERIWTEPRHIEQKLTDLTEHMETVIQKYLRNEYETIAEYNAQAGQLAEPLRIVVIADFPAGFNDSAMRRVSSILQSGPRCGVHLLLMRDASKPFPPSILEADVLRCCRKIFWKQESFHIDQPALQGECVTVDAPPSATRLQELLRGVGQAAKSASIVQVPFSAIAPSAEQVWTASSAGTVDVPVGRTGATQLQRLLLGEGTRQHVLLAGKTGSGKSTLLNAMIVNLASWFSPDEIELWLIDFKKGVEFKVYAANNLPHARAVAVESDREFGLSVLQGLDAELKRRGDMFRAAGVQDLGAWRRLKKPQPLPRALLIVDEFQELFIEEDKVSQEASLLLDRLVRQGRAFGMHVILGSQTLGGAYALPRTTMGQMGVRIALQCNEADAALILSDDNTAARLLSRPGEAIYNDAGGMIEGNSPFQVVWLGDHEREQRVRELAQRGAATASTRPAMIVFDGTSKASIARCRPLRERMRQPLSTSSVPLHLGEPVAIREATVAMMRRQSGANMLVVGQDDRMAIGLSLAALASIRAAVGEGAQITILDGSSADSAESNILAATAQQLGLLAEVPSYRDVDACILRLGEVVAARIESARTDQPPRFLLVHGIQRFRSLRRDENDFSFSASDAPLKPDRIFASILRDGPAVGVHLLVWADTAASLQRSVERSAMREFDLRVLMQMGANDSSALIDSPVASRLGAERALLFSEERGTVERFRPFEPLTLPEIAELLALAATEVH